MKLGVFDSGLGGLIIAKSIQDIMPDHHMIYLGDTLHVPYGSKSIDAVREYTHQSIDYLFCSDCQLIIMACNTASALTLRDLQQNYLPQHYPGRRILGVVVPTLETAIEKRFKKIGLLATERIIQSNVYKNELNKIDPTITLIQQAAPLLVPLIELGAHDWIKPILQKYLGPLIIQKIECLILGCTHYIFLKEMIRDLIGDDIYIMSQDEIIPQKLMGYLQKHTEINEKINQDRISEFFVTDVTDTYINNAQQIYGRQINIQKTKI